MVPKSSYEGGRWCTMDTVYSGGCGVAKDNKEPVKFWKVVTHQGHAGVAFKLRNKQRRY